MKKKYVVLLASTAIVLGIAVGATAAGVIRSVQAELRPDFTVMVDGVEQQFRDVNGKVVDPLLYDGTTYLPVRAIGNLMGKTVYWYEREKRIELKNSDTTVTDADVIITGDGSQKVPADSGAGASAATGKVPVEGNTSAAAGEISLEQAKAIALEKAGFSADQVRFTEAKPDFDDRVREYDIEFYKDGVEYSAEIRASDGKYFPGK